MVRMAYSLPRQARQCTPTHQLPGLPTPLVTSFILNSTNDSRVDLRSATKSAKHIASPGQMGWPPKTSVPSWFHRHPEVSLEVVEETLLIIQESQRDHLLDLDEAVSRWMFSVPDLLQVSSICDWKNLDLEDIPCWIQSSSAIDGRR